MGGVVRVPHQPRHVGARGFPATVGDPAAVLGRRGGRRGDTRIPDVPKPAWLQSATWADASRGRVWRAEEMELVTEPVVAVTGTMLTAPPVLPDT